MKDEARPITESYLVAITKEDSVLFTYMSFTPMAAPPILPVRSIRRQVFSIDKALNWVNVGFIDDRVNSQVAI